MKRILITNIFGIGDVLFTTTLIPNLEKKYGSNVVIDYMCNVRVRDVLECVPGINNIYIYEKDDFDKLWKKSKSKWFEELKLLFSSIRSNKYDMVFDFTLSRKFGLFFLLAGIKKRIGLDYKKRGLFLTQKEPLVGFSGRHVIEYYLSLLDKIGVPAEDKSMYLIPEEEDVDWAKLYLCKHDCKGKKVVAIIPGGGASWGKHASRKRWNTKGYAATADILYDNDACVVILGDLSEKAVCTEVSARMKRSPHIQGNRFSIRKYIALLSVCDLVLCNDGGPLHMAVALGKKTVSIFGPVDDEVYGPYPRSDKHKVVTADLECRPCYDKFKLPDCGHEHMCVTSIEPDEVAHACLELLEGPVRTKEVPKDLFE